MSENRMRGTEIAMRLPERSSKQTAHELCNGTNICVPANMRHETRYRKDSVSKNNNFPVAPDYNMIHCVVHKSMSTVITGIMCYLFNPSAYTEADKKRNMSEWDKAAFCRSKNTYKYLKPLLKKTKTKSLDEWSLSMITRDPIDRFISGYVDRCIRVAEQPMPCNGCGKNMTCFVISEYERFMRQTKVGVLTNTFEDRHFYPQNWRCDLKRLRDKYEFIRYSSDPSKQLMSDLFKLARRQHVPEYQLEFIKQELTRNRKTSHTTAFSPARQFFEKRLYDSPFLMEYVIKMFYHDFIILNYPFPDGF